MDAVAFACLNGVLAGAFTVILRVGLRRAPDSEVASLTVAGVGLVVASVAAVAFGAGLDEVDLGELWPFLAIGVAVPGLAGVVFSHSVRTAGASRAAIVLAASPLLSALLAVALLDEPFRAALAAGTVLIVAGGAAIAWEGSRPVGFKVVGLVLALIAAVVFSVRDIVVRWASGETAASPQVAMAAAFAAATVAILLYLLLSSGPSRATTRVRDAFPHFVPAGLVLAVAQIAFFEALARGRVTVVAPLVATHAMWTVVFSALLLRRAEAINRRLVVAAVLVVAGGVLVGLVRSPTETGSAVNDPRSRPPVTQGSPGREYARRPGVPPPPARFASDGRRPGSAPHHMRPSQTSPPPDARRRSSPRIVLARSPR